jgi:Tol biopolymer transport system component
MSKRYLSIFILFLLSLQLFLAGDTLAQETLSFEGQIVYIGPDGNVWVRRGDGSGPLQLTVDAEESRHYTSPRFSPNGSMLAYCQRSAPGSGKGQLFITRVGEWQPFVLVKDVFCQDGPRSSFDWTVDSTQILYAPDFSSEEGGDGSKNGIWTVHVISGETSQLIAPPGGSPLVRPEASPNGTWVKLYEIPYIEGLGVLRTLDGETGSLYNWLGIKSQLFPGKSSWAPDGNQIVIDEVTYAGFPGAGLYIASPNGENLSRIFSKNNKVATNPLWSTDGSNIAFKLVAFNGRRGQLMLVSPDGSNEREIFQGESDVVPVVWSPSGGQLLFGAVEGERVNLFVHDLATGTNILFDWVGGWGADWSLVPAVTEMVDESSPTSVPDFPFSEGLLVYVAEDYRLVLRDPASGIDADLSKPMSVAEFKASPSGQRILYGSQLVVLDFQEDGSLTVYRYSLPIAPNGEQISWSPDESRFGYRDRDDKIWIADTNGNAVEIPGANSLPAWSYDGRWIGYCSEGEELMVFGPDVPPKKVARPAGCEPQWSPSQYLLAYDQFSEDGVGTPQVAVYDPIKDSTTVIDDVSSLLSWSPDGELLAFKKANTDKEDVVAVYVVNPTDGTQLLVGMMDSSEAKNLEWVRQPGGYLIGPYRVTTDLSSANRVTDFLLDASQGGVGMLSGVGVQDLITITCLDPESGIQENLVTVNLSGISPDMEPGVEGELSPLGNWVSLLVYDRGDFVHQLRLCGSVREVSFPVDGTSTLGSFSGDDRWYAQRQSLAGDVEQILLYDLALESTIVLPTVNRAQYSWLKPLISQVGGNYILAGQVRSDGDEAIPDVTILVDGMEMATTGRNGRFKIEHLSPGSYVVAAEHAGINLSPNSILINLPPNAEGVDFAGRLPISEELPQTSDIVASEEDEPEVDVRSESEQQSMTIPFQSLDETGFILLVGGSVFILVVFITFLLLYRRRRSRAVVPSPEISAVKVSKSEGPTQPVRVAPIEDAPMPGAQTQPLEVRVKADVPKSEVPVEPVAEEQILNWLIEGIEQIKGGGYKAGTEKLIKVLQEMPENASAWMWLGWAAGKQNDLRKAEGCFTEARRLGHPRAEEGLAWLKRKQ